jgi:hypothetical protein
VIAGQRTREIRFGNYQSADVEDLNRNAIAALWSSTRYFAKRKRASQQLMGFIKAHDATPIFGVAYDIHTKIL